MSGGEEDGEAEARGEQGGRGPRIAQRRELAPVQGDNILTQDRLADRPRRGVSDWALSQTRRGGRREEDDEEEEEGGGQ